MRITNGERYTLEGVRILLDWYFDDEFRGDMRADLEYALSHIHRSFKAALLWRAAGYTARQIEAGVATRYGVRWPAKTLWDKAEKALMVELNGGEREDCGVRAIARGQDRTFQLAA